ncbi:hypothetical protein CPF11_06490 [Acetobacter pomorum]|nr:hypothetical protein CPF11_06490 [Acetobacter pomorum]
MSGVKLAHLKKRIVKKEDSQPCKPADTLRRDGLQTGHGESIALPVNPLLMSEVGGGGLAALCRVIVETGHSDALLPHAASSLRKQPGES